TVVARVDLDRSDSPFADRVDRADAVERAIAVTCLVTGGDEHSDLRIPAVESRVGQAGTASGHAVAFDRRVEGPVDVSNLEAKIALASGGDRARIDQSHVGGVDERTSAIAHCRG